MKKSLPSKPSIPPHGDLDTKVFSKRFQLKNSSRMIFWSLALLEVVKQYKYDMTHPIRFNDMFFIVLKQAKQQLPDYPALSLHRDWLRDWVISLDKSASRGEFHWDTADARLIEKNFENPIFQDACKRFTADIPYRWLLLFVKQEIQDAGDSTRTWEGMKQLIVQATEKKWGSSQPTPYHIIPQKQIIIVHPCWAKYFNVQLGAMEKLRYASIRLFLHVQQSKLSKAGTAK